jgi:hypothetical protein
MAREKTKVVVDHGPTGFVFFLAWVGAAVYFVQKSEGFGEFIVALLQSAVWPAYVLYYVLRLLGA